MPQFSLDEAQLHIEELIELALSGEDVIVADGEARVRLVPIIENGDCER